jgi:hypothetical protein
MTEHVETAENAACMEEIRKAHKHFSKPQG